MQNLKSIYFFPPFQMYHNLRVHIAQLYSLESEGRIKK